MQSSELVEQPIDANMLYFFAARVVDGNLNKSIVFEDMIGRLNKRKRFPVTESKKERYYIEFEKKVNSMYRIKRMYFDEIP